MTGADSFSDCSVRASGRGRTAAGTGYEISGRRHGPVVVLLHGVGLDRTMWRAWMSRLTPHFAVVTYDLLGHGESDNRPGPRTARQFCDQLLELVDTLGLARFALVGFSIGALITAAFAVLYPGRLRQAVFLHGVYRRTPQQQAAAWARYRLTQEKGPLATVELAIDRWYSREFIAANPERMDELRRLFATHHDDGYLAAYRFFCAAEAEMKDFAMDQVQVPALVLTGDADVGSTAAMAEAMAADLPEAKLIINPGHRHMAPDEHAPILAAQVVSFLIGG